MMIFPIFDGDAAIIYRGFAASVKLPGLRNHQGPVPVGAWWLCSKKLHAFQQFFIERIHFPVPPSTQLFVYEAFALLPVLLSIQGQQLVVCVNQLLELRQFMQGYEFQEAIGLVWCEIRCSTYGIKLQYCVTVRHEISAVTKYNVHLYSF